LSVFTLLAAGAVGGAQADPSAVTRSAMLANTCLSCHAAKAADAGAIPSLSGYPKNVMVQQMKAFRDGSRPNTIMGRHAKGYSDEEIALIAEYLSTLK
jgi:sulfide dehydrogenase cytochrome subunit